MSMPNTMSIEDIFGLITRSVGEETIVPPGITASPGDTQAQVVYAWAQLIDTRRTFIEKQQRLRATYGDFGLAMELELEIWIMGSNPTTPELHKFGRTKDKQITHHIFRGDRWAAPSEKEDAPSAYRHRIWLAIDWLHPGQPAPQRPPLRSV